MDRVVATGPALNPYNGLNEGWLFTKYDVFNRVCFTGWFATTFTPSSRANLQSDLNTIHNAETVYSTIDGTTVGYNNLDLPPGFQLLTVIYYDNYNYPNAPTVVGPIMNQAILDNVKGLQTGSWIRVLTKEGERLAETSCIVYDKKSRPISILKKNYMGGYTNTITTYDFIGKPLQIQTAHKRKNNATQTQVIEDYEYSPQGRLINNFHKINALDRELLSHNSYDELGNLITKIVGGSDVTTFTGLQKVDYKYNIRGWLTEINDVTNLSDTPSTDLFAFKINYNNVEGASQVDELFNGNISETLWRTGSDNIKRLYGYQYDGLNRLRDAIYERPGVTDPVTHSYDESMNYDKNGNITDLHRNGNAEGQLPLEIDDLTYTYNPDSPNLLMDVTDSTNHPKGFSDHANDTNDYTYDLYGNLKSDTNKKINSITYNHLNLPLIIEFSGGSKISYRYDANGKKFTETIMDNGNPDITDYLDGFQYKNNKLQFFPTSEGYVRHTVNENTPGAGYFNYVYNYLDHLGNIRVSYSKDPFDNVIKILQENHYYPFGLKHTNYNSDMRDIKKDVEVLKIKPVEPFEKTPYRYKFQGQEYQGEFGLNWDSFKWRNYDAAIGRFMSIDPLTEDYPEWSPYVFSGNRVIDAREIEGMEPYVLFGSQREAAKNFSTLYNATSILNKREYATRIYTQRNADGTNSYGYVTPTEGKYKNFNQKRIINVPKNTLQTAVAHTHSAFDKNWNSNIFSGKRGSTNFGDIGIAERNNWDIYAATPNGSFLEYDFETDEITSLDSEGIAYDGNDPISPGDDDPDTNQYNTEFCTENEVGDRNRNDEAEKGFFDRFMPEMNKPAEDQED